MKFTIITHAEHKIKGTSIYAYEPYVREMNLWLKHVDEVMIVGPVSNEAITVIEVEYKMNTDAQIATSLTPRNDKDIRHPEFSSGSHDLKRNDEMLKQVQHDEKDRHSVQSEAILSMEQNVTSKTYLESSRNAPRNDEQECHTEPVEVFQMKKESEKSLRQAQTDNKKITLTSIPAFDITSLKNGVLALFKIPKICIQIYKAMQWADHIHLRCPGNIGLLGCFVQILFPNKPKTVKYAGNWDQNSKQPLGYRLQKWILSNTFLTRNAKVLVYGEWPNQTKNIVPFFTASYSEKEIICNTHKDNRHSQLDWESHDLKHKGQIPNQVQHDEYKDKGCISFIFVGTLSKGKQPMLSVQVIYQLKQRGYKVKLDVYGEGEERVGIENYIDKNNLQNEIILHGNVSKNCVKKAYQKSHFLLFISKSEGWPKVVAEAMFWGCLPISSSVSCIPYMLNQGIRGAIVNPNKEEIISVIESYINDKDKYKEQTLKAMEWSRQYTLEKFGNDIGKLLTSP